MDKKPVRKFYLKQFKSISHAIASYEDLNLLLSHLAEGTCRTFEAKACSILIWDEREKALYHVSDYGLSKDYLGKKPRVRGEEYFIAYKDEPVFIKNMQNDPRIQFPEAAAQEGFVSMLSVPINCRERPIGLLRMYFCESGTVHPVDIDSLFKLTHQLGVVIENVGMKNFIEQLKIAMENLPLYLLGEK